jgi:tetratricopeptide (TPR) repeat protein
MRCERWSSTKRLDWCFERRTRRIWRGWWSRCSQIERGAWSWAGPPGNGYAPTAPGSKTPRSSFTFIGRSELSTIRAEIDMQAPITITDTALASDDNERFAGRHDTAASKEQFFREHGIDAYKRGNYQQAQVWFRRAIAVQPTRPWGWLWQARTQLKLGDTLGSFESIHKALELKPEWPAAMWHLIDLLERENLRDECIELLIKVRALQPPDVATLAKLSKRFLRLKVYSEASVTAEALLNIDPNNEDALFVKAIALWKCGDSQAAQGVIGSDLASRTPAANRALAQIYLEIDDARRAWATIAALTSDQINPKLLVQIAQSLRKGGYLRLALEAFERVLSCEPGNGEAQHWRRFLEGEICVLRGNWKAPTALTGNFVSIQDRVLLIDRRQIAAVLPERIHGADAFSSARAQLSRVGSARSFAARISLEPKGA